MKQFKRAVRLLAFVLIIFSVLSVPISAAHPDEARTLREVYVRADLNGYQIPYVLYLPANYDESESYPVLLFLHGAGERGSDNKLQLLLAVDNLYETRPDLLNEAIFIAPQCPTGERWVEWDWTNGNYPADEIPESKPLSTAVMILEEVLETYAADKSRVYVMGLSMGGFGTWDMLVRHESLLAAGVPICGGGDPSKADILKDIPIWCVHGSNDITVPFAGTDEMYDSIRAAGGERIIFEPLQNKSHNVWDYASCNGEMIDWLFAQTRELRYPPAPETELQTEAVPSADTETEGSDSSSPAETETAPSGEELPDGAARIIIPVAAGITVCLFICFLCIKKKK